MTTLRFVERLRDLVDGVEVILSDIWGVVHNGLEAFPDACAALHTYRQQGGTVILITNAPRAQADYIVCTGLVDDETETPEDYRDMMLQARARKLPFICANPDIVVERG